MKRNSHLLAGALGSCCLLVASLSFAQGECVMPEAPSIPDGANASEQELVGVAGEIKIFQQALADYRECLQAEEQELGDDATPEQKQGFVASYNTSVDEEEAVAADWNTAVQAFKAASQN